jgi:hypothetical protein
MSRVRFPPPAPKISLKVLGCLVPLRWLSARLLACITSRSPEWAISCAPGSGVAPPETVLEGAIPPDSGAPREIPPPSAIRSTARSPEAAAFRAGCLADLATSDEFAQVTGDFGRIDFFRGEGVAGPAKHLAWRSWLESSRPRGTLRIRESHRRLPVALAEQRPRSSRRGRQHGATTAVVHQWGPALSNEFYAFID